METLYVKDRKQWRAWLDKNARSFSEIWLTYPRKHSGKACIPYGDAVEEALCFGWIDGIKKRLDSDHSMQRFTPRKPTSRWSAINIKRAQKLIAEKRMTTAGLQAFRPECQIEAHPTALPPDLQTPFSSANIAWNNFQSFPPFYRKMTIAWVATAKKEETQLKRLKKLIEFSEKNKRLKFM